MNCVPCRVYETLRYIQNKAKDAGHNLYEVKAVIAFAQDTEPLGDLEPSAPADALGNSLSQALIDDHALSEVQREILRLLAEEPGVAWTKNKLAVQICGGQSNNPGKPTGSGERAIIKALTGDLATDALGLVDLGLVVNGPPFRGHDTYTKAGPKGEVGGE